MFPRIATNNPKAVEAEVQSEYLAMFPKGDRQFVPRIFGWATEAFTGGYKDYQPVDVPYHNFEHTLQGTLCLARLLRARQRAGAQPSLPQRVFELAVVAILMHDTGYLKKRSDVGGTGAKYTMTHVNRSIEFAGELLRDKGFGDADVEAVQQMIHCTGFDAKVKSIPFRSEEERIAGYALGTSDLLGQMAADDYVEKLPSLYVEFAEAAKQPGPGMHPANSYSSAEELTRHTPRFWEEIARPKLERDFAGLYRFFNDPYPDGRNQYLDGIEANMNKLRQQTQPSARI